MKNKYFLVLLLFCTYSFSQELNYENEKSIIPQIKYQGVSEISELPKTNDEIETFQKDISSSVKSLDSLKSLTKDYFSNLASKTDSKILSSGLENKDNVPTMNINKEVGVEPNKNYNENSVSISEDDNIIFTVLGLMILGHFIRAVFKDRAIAQESKSVYSFIIQFIISILVGAFVYFLIIPQSWKRESDIDTIDIMILK